MSTLSLRLPQSIHQNAKLYAQRGGHFRQSVGGDGIG